MKRSDDMVWYAQPTRQSPIAILMIVVSIIKSLIRVWWPIILVLFFRSNFVGPTTGKALIIGITILIILFSIWRYYRFHFYLSDTKLHVQSGVFTRTRMDIPFDRIQTVSFEQNIVHQVFNVTALKIDTAGSSKEEFEFAALEKEKAEELRTFILSKKTSSTIVSTDTNDLTTEESNLVVNLGISDLLKVGISQNHLRTTGIIVAFLLGLRDRIDEALGDSYLDQFDSLAEQLYQNIFTYGLVLFLLLLIISFIGTLIYTVFRYYDLKLWKTRDGYKVQAGLLNRIEQTALDHKVQIIRWVSNPIRKLYGIVHLRFYQASSSTGSKSINITIPGCPVEELEGIARYAFGKKFVQPQIKHGIDRRLFYRRWFFIGLPPSLILLSVGWFDENPTWYLLALLWIVIIGVFQHFYQRKWTFYLTENECIMSYGVIEMVTKALSMYKVQGVQIKQSPYQRRKSLASLVLHTASGDASIPYIPYTSALQIKNYLLFKAESSRKKWM